MLSIAPPSYPGKGLKPVFQLANFFGRSDLFPLSAFILPRLADVISDTDKGKRSLRARKFASGKPALHRLVRFGRRCHVRLRALTYFLINLPEYS
jgi:hypothetical protein